MKQKVIVLILSFAFLSFSNFNLEKELIGEWIISGTEHNGIQTLCNSCPTIVFKNNATATLTLPNKEVEEYNWTVTNNNLRIEELRKSSSKQYFLNSTYSAKIEQDSKAFKLSLIQADGLKYVLRKSKSDQ